MNQLHFLLQVPFIQITWSSVSNIFQALLNLFIQTRPFLSYPSFLSLSVFRKCLNTCRPYFLLYMPYGGPHQSEETGSVQWLVPSEGDICCLVLGCSGAWVRALTRSARCYGEEDDYSATNHLTCQATATTVHNTGSGNTSLSIKLLVVFKISFTTR